MVNSPSLKFLWEGRRREVLRCLWFPKYLQSRPSPITVPLAIHPKPTQPSPPKTHPWIFFATLLTSSLTKGTAAITDCSRLGSERFTVCST